VSLARGYTGIPWLKRYNMYDSRLDQTIFELEVAFLLGLLYNLHSSSVFLDIAEEVHVV